MTHPLVQTWIQAHEDFREVAAAAPWRHATAVPGWTVADLVAHTAWIERTALGLTDPLHEPDWAALPHVSGDFGRRSEVPVDLRRARGRDEVLTELDEAVAARREILLDTPDDALVANLFGIQRPLWHVLRERVFDLWVHEQDIRVAVDRPGHLDSDGARAAAEVLLDGLGYLWAKRARAPIGATLVVRTTPPGLALAGAVAREQDGRARPVPEPDGPTTSLTVPFPDFVALACGRLNADPRSVTIEGDRELGERVVDNFAITP